MYWFGPTWHAPVCETNAHRPTPSVPCELCLRDFKPEEQGFLWESRGQIPVIAYHRLCFAATLGQAPITHILHYGWPLCGFSSEQPSQWPSPHRGVNRSEASKANCGSCIKAATK